jgi:hypothetical protein
MSYLVTVQEVRGGSHLHNQNVWLEGQALLVHDWMLRRRREGFARDLVHVHYRLSADAGDASANGPGACSERDHKDYQHDYDDVAIHDPPWNVSTLAY